VVLGCVASGSFACRRAENRQSDERVSRKNQKKKVFFFLEREEGDLIALVCRFHLTLVSQERHQVEESAVWRSSSLSQSELWSAGRIKWSAKRDWLRARL